MPRPAARTASARPSMRRPKSTPGGSHGSATRGTSPANTAGRELRRRARSRRAPSTPAMPAPQRCAARTGSAADQQRRARNGSSGEDERQVTGQRSPRPLRPGRAPRCRPTASVSSVSGITNAAASPRVEQRQRVVVLRRQHQVRGVGDVVAEEHAALPARDLRPVKNTGRQAIATASITGRCRRTAATARPRAARARRCRGQPSTAEDVEGVAADHVADGDVALALDRRP